MYCVSIVVLIDKENERMVLSIQDIWVSRHKDVHPEDSDGPEDIGLSSEEEAEGMEEDESIARKYHQRAGPAPAPGAPPAPRATSTETGTSTTDPEVATLQVPVAALQQVQEMIGKILGGEAPAAGFPQPAPQPPAGADQGAPFSIPKPKRGEKKCSVCQRAFWSTTTLRQHMKTHTGEQKHTCPNAGCGRKLSSKRSLETQLQTCQKEKTHFCKHKDCKKLFATEAGLKAHSLTHKTLSKKKSVCTGCGKGGFTKKKSLKDHFRYCDGNPEKVGPFPCLVPGCARGPAKPFRCTRNLNMHMKEVHDFDPKHA